MSPSKAEGPGERLVAPDARPTHAILAAVRQQMLVTSSLAASQEDVMSGVWLATRPGTTQGVG
jgi:hypothetical protein